jgi:hypothetical protein
MTDEFSGSAGAATMAQPGGEGKHFAPNPSPLARRLLAPARRLSLAVLPAQWFHSLVALRCPGAGQLAGDPRLPGKLRGAWGRQLCATASAAAAAGDPCPWQPPCALDVLFRCQGHITPALEIPKPYVLALDAEGADLVVRLTLFGFATDWTEAAAEALLRALRNGLSGMPPLAVAERRIWSEDGLAPAAAARAAWLRFATPCVVRQSGVARPPDLPTLVATLANRVSGLARWQDAALDLPAAALKRHAAGLAVATGEQVPARWRRYSGRQGRWVPVHATRSDMLVEGDLAPLLPLLALGATTHAGSHAALGLGRYALVLAG